MKVVIIDDDYLVVQSLKTIVSAGGIEVLAVGHNGNDAINLYREFKPDLMLMDVRMDGIDGIDATRIILDEFSDAKILLITTFEDSDYIKEALALGCKGYLLKQNISGIIPAINAIIAGNYVFDSKTISNMQVESKKVVNKSLTDREFDILLLVAEGLNNREIADKLFLSEGTVRNYISIMLEKLSLRDRTQLAIYYYKI